MPEEVKLTPPAPVPAPAAKPAEATPAKTTLTPPATSEPAAVPAPEPTGYTVVMPTLVTAGAAEDWSGHLESFGAVAEASGLPAATAQTLVDTFAHTSVAFGETRMMGEDEHTSTSAERSLRRYWGTEYEARIKEVWAITNANPRLRDWLEDTNVGNDPAAIAALALLPDARLTREQASAELAKVMATKKFTSGDKPTVARVALLSRLANTDPDEQRGRIESAERSRETAARNAATAERLTAKQSARAEAAALLPIINKGPPAERKAASARWIQLVATL